MSETSGTVAVCDTDRTPHRLPMRSGYKIVERGLRLGLMDTVDEADIFRDHNDKLVLNGAMGVSLVEASSGWLNRGVAAFHLELGTYECLLSPLAE